MATALEIYKNSITPSNRLRTNDSLGKAVFLDESEPLGEGAQGAAFKGRLDMNELTEDGKYQLALPMLAHQHLQKLLEQQPEPNGLIDKAYATASEELSDMTANAMEDIVRSTLVRQNMLKEEGRKAYCDIAVRITLDPVMVDRPRKDDQKDSVVVDFRQSRQEKYLLGLEHPNIVYHLAMGIVMPSKRAYSVMELLGGTLKPAHTMNWPLEQKLGVMRKVIDGLKLMKLYGIVNRDIKPDNIYLTVTPDLTNPWNPWVQIKLADYGIMDVENVDFTQKTVEGAHIGTPGYVSPEQVIDATKATWRSDQFSAGATFYTLFTNKSANPMPPNSPRSLVAAVDNAVNRPIPPDSIVIRPDTQLEGLEMVLGHMMKKDPEDRYDDYQELLEDIDTIEAKKLPKHSSYYHAQTVFKGSPHTTYALQERKAKFKRKAIAASIAAAVLGGATIIYFKGC